jgi:NAD(P) transhydrogenase
MLADSSAEIFQRACFNYPTLGDLYKHATWEAVLTRDGIEIPGPSPFPD